MAHLVLVHGAWEGAWSWDYTLPVLKNNGHTVTTVDLPGSTDDGIDISQVTLDAYVKRVIETISPLDHKVVLIGHSMAGAVISQVAELIPEKLEKLVYVTAFLLRDGDSILEAMKRDPDGEFLSKLIFTKDDISASATERTWRDIAFHDVREARVEEALQLVVGVEQAVEPFTAKISVSKERFGSVPKVYIRTALDKMISPKLQEEMLGGWDVDQIHVLQAGHFPTLSLPESLAELMS